MANKGKSGGEPEKKIDDGPLNRNREVKEEKDKILDLRWDAGVYKDL